MKRYFRKTLLGMLLATFSVSSFAAGALVDVLAPHRGAVTYVDFWASWCAPCAESFPWLNAMKQKYEAQGLRVVAVNLDSQKALADRFLKVHPASFPVVSDPDGRLAEQFNIEGMPFAVILDEEGQVIHRHSGYRQAESSEYERAIQRALSKKESAK